VVESTSIELHGSQGASIVELLAYSMFPLAAIGYSLVYLLAGGGVGGAILIFIVAKMLGD
jgi:hypothetical protein